MSKRFFKLFFLACLFLVPLSAVKAADTKTGNSVYVSKDQIISGNLYAAGQTVTIDGTISGDLITAAQTITVNGQVGGDIIAVGQNIIINGNVDGNIRAAGSSLTINGAVTRNVDAFGANIILGQNSRVGWDVFLVAETAEIRGTIDGGLSGRAGQVLVVGKIGKSLDLTLMNPGSGALTVASEAVINGDLNYTAKDPGTINAQANIAGKVTYNLPASQPANPFIIWLWRELFTMFSAMVVGLALIFVTKNMSQKILADLSSSPLKLLLPGLIIFFILPPIAIVLLFTIIGIPLALIVGASWLIAVYIAKILAAILVGQVLINILTKNNNSSLLGSLVLGVIICWLLFAIPWIGWIIGLLAIWLGLGGLWSYASSQLRHI